MESKLRIMKTIEQLINSLFPSRRLQRKGKLPVYSGMLVRTDDFSRKYQQWKLSERLNELLGLLKGHYQQCRRHQGEPTAFFGIHKDQGFSGFYVAQNSQIEHHEFPYLLDYLFENAKKLNYRHYHSFEEHREQGDDVVSKQSHYLKPSIQSFEPPLNQEYGNILLELESHNDVPRYMKLKVTSYSGFDYEPPKDFDELVEKLVA